jgi:hypothetical protein
VLHWPEPNSQEKRRGGVLRTITPPSADKRHRPTATGAATLASKNVKKDFSYCARVFQTKGVTNKRESAIVGSKLDPKRRNAASLRSGRFLRPSVSASSVRRPLACLPILNRSRGGVCPNRVSHPKAEGAPWHSRTMEDAHDPVATICSRSNEFPFRWNNFIGIYLDIRTRISCP